VKDRGDHPQEYDARAASTTTPVESVSDAPGASGARSISDQGWSEFRRQITYKAEWMGVPLFIAPSNFASSKTCSRCGERKESLTLADRIFRCDRCGLEIDRDLNAARNLRKEAMMAIARGESKRPMTLSGQDSVKRRLTPRRTQPSAAGL